MSRSKPHSRRTLSTTSAGNSGSTARRFIPPSGATPSSGVVWPKKTSSVTGPKGFSAGLQTSRSGRSETEGADAGAAAGSVWVWTGGISAWYSAPMRDSVMMRRGGVSSGWGERREEGGPRAVAPLGGGAGSGSASEQHRRGAGWG
eukprot:scaffold11434_cov127-Isochrysis_galbana.AAC.9